MDSRSASWWTAELVCLAAPELLNVRIMVLDISLNSISGALPDDTWDWLQKAFPAFDMRALTNVTVGTKEVKSEDATSATTGGD